MWRYLIVLILLQGCGVNSGALTDLNINGSNSLTPTISSDDELPISQNSDGSYVRQALSFFPSDATSNDGPPVNYIGKSN